MRIAYFINCFPNVIETMIYREVEALRQVGYQIVTFSIRRPPDGLVPGDALSVAARTTYLLPIPISRMLLRHLGALVRFPLRYWRVLFEVMTGIHGRSRDRLRTLCHFVEAVTILPEIERMSIDHLHAHWAVGATTVAMVVSRFLDIPFSFTAHAYDIWREQLLLPEKLRAAALTMTCTDCNRQRLIDAYGAEPAKVRVVYHGLDLNRFQPRAHPANAIPRILSVGRLVEQKGYDRLLRACAALAAEGLEFECCIVGEGPLRAELESLTAALGLTERVRFLGKLFQDKVIEEYERADLFALYCIPARDDDRDGIPNTLIEAMAMELPVVSTHFSGIPELVVDGEAGLLVDTHDDNEAVAALRALLGDPQRRHRMGQAGRRKVRESFAIETTTTLLDQIFQEITARDIKREVSVDRDRLTCAESSVLETH